MSSDEKPSFVNDIFYHDMRKPFAISGNISEDSFECPNPSHFHPKLAYVPSREEVSELFSRIPFFTEREPLVQDMRVLFSAMQQILVEVNEDPSQSFMAKLPVWYFEHYHCLHNSYEGLHSFWDNESGKSSFFFSLVTFLVFPSIYCFIMISLAPMWYLEFVILCSSECNSSNH